MLMTIITTTGTEARGQCLHGRTIKVGVITIITIPTIIHVIMTETFTTMGTTLDRVENILIVIIKIVTGLMTGIVVDLRLLHMGSDGQMLMVITC